MAALDRPSTPAGNLAAVPAGPATIPAGPATIPAGPATIPGGPAAEAERVAEQLIAIRQHGDRVALTGQALLVARDGRRAGEVVGCLGDVIHRRTPPAEPDRVVDFEVPNFGLGTPLVAAATQYVNAITNRQVLTQRAIMEDWESADLPAQHRLYLMATVVFLLTAVAANLAPAGTEHAA